MTTTAPYYQLREHSIPNNGTFQDTGEEGFPAPSSGAPTASIYQEGSHSVANMDSYGNGTAASTTSGAQLHDPQLEGNMAELIEAATSAAGQVQAAMDAANGRRLAHSNELNLSGAPVTPIRGERRKRGRSGSAASQQLQDEDDDLGNLSDVSVRNKRQKLNELNGTEQDFTQGDSDHPNSLDHPDPASLFAEARAAGVHSAVALFRRPSANKAKKYTRPPMSKLFMSLQLTPENFLHLQAAAKNYMLDRDHPERQNCVGNRGKGDTDMVKLRLFNCVRDFLQDDVGERFFGENADTPSEIEGAEMAAVLGQGQVTIRKHIWPRDANKIISLVTPLLRRMVTNERQRLYAIDTRKSGSITKKPSKEKDVTDQDQDDILNSGSASRQLNSPHGEQTLGNTPVDPTLHQPYSYTHTTIHPTYGSPSPYISAGNQSLAGDNMIQIIITKNNTKLIPRLDIPSRTASTYHDIPFQDLQHIIGVQLNQLPQVVLDPHISQARYRPASTLSPSTSAQPATNIQPTDLSDEQPAKAFTPQPTVEEPPKSNSSACDSGALASLELFLKQSESRAAAATEVAEPTIHHDESQAMHSPISPSTETQDAAAEAIQQLNGQMAAAAAAEKLYQSPALQVDIRALTGAGLVPIRTEDDWESVKAEVERAAWMEGVLKIVVEVLS